MPNTNIQTGQDWGTVNVGRASAGRVAVPKSAAGITRAKALGLVATVSFHFILIFRRFLNRIVGWMLLIVVQSCMDKES